MNEYFVTFTVLEGDTFENHKHHEIELKIKAENIEEALLKAKSIFTIEVSSTEVYSPNNQFRAYMGNTGETIRRN